MKVSECFVLYAANVRENTNNTVNMSGKSVYLRSIALLVIMAQTGSLYA